MPITARRKHAKGQNKIIAKPEQSLEPLLEDVDPSVKGWLPPDPDEMRLAVRAILICTYALCSNRIKHDEREEPLPEPQIDVNVLSVNSSNAGWGATLIEQGEPCGEPKEVHVWEGQFEKESQGTADQPEVEDPDEAQSFAVVDSPRSLQDDCESVIGDASDMAMSTSSLDSCSS